VHGVNLWSSLRLTLKLSGSVGVLNRTLAGDRRGGPKLTWLIKFRIGDWVGVTTLGHTGYNIKKASPSVVVRQRVSTF
jgi:hypothetical protein